MKNLRFIFGCLVACAVPSLSAQVFHQIQYNLGSVNVGSSSSTIIVTIPLTAQGTIAKVTATTGGVENLDFINPGGSISVTCNPGNSFGAILIPCTANVKFQPRSAGARYGSIAVWGTNGQLMGSVYLQGTGLGPQTSFSPATQTKLLGNYYRPNGLAAASDGSVYAVIGAYQIQLGGGTPAYGSVVKIPGDTAATAISPNFPTDVSVDGAGNTYVVDAIDWESILQQNGTYNLFHIPFSDFLTADASGNLYANCTSGICKETLQSDGTYVESVITSMNSLYVPYVDGSGNVFAIGSSDGTCTLYKFTLYNTNYTQSTVTSGATLINAVTADGAGNIYFADTSGNVYKERALADGSYVQTSLFNGSVTQYTSDFGDGNVQGSDGANRLAADLPGNLYFWAATGPDSHGFATYGLFKENYSLPSTLSFPTTVQGSKSGAQTVTITNSGNLPLQFSAIAFPPDFQEATTAGECTEGTSLEPNTSCTLTINFAPITPVSGTSGVLTEQVLITSNIANAPGTQQAITVTGTENARVATPTVSLPAGVYYTTQTVTLADTTPGAKIYYTLNGSTPTTSSMLAKGPIAIKSAETLKAIAVAPGYADSPVISAYYALTAPTPVISPAGGTFTGSQTVTITTATPIEFIFYTTGNSFPTTSSPRYTGPITVSSSENVIAFAFQTGFLASPIVRQKFVITAPPESVTK